MIISNKMFRAFAAKLRPRLAFDELDADQQLYERRKIEEFAKQLLADLGPERVVLLVDKLNAALNGSAVGAMDEKVFPHSGRLRGSGSGVRPSLADTRQFPHAHRLRRS